MNTMRSGVSARILAGLFAMSPALLGCTVKQNQTGPNEVIWTQTTAKTNAELAYDRSSRVVVFLAQCTDPTASGEANAARSQVQDAGKSLIDLVNTNPVQYGGTSGWVIEEQKRMDALEIAQVRAYNAAVACGLAEPGYPNPGGWSATWFDISS